MNKKMKPSIAILVLGYNDRAHLKDAIESVRSQKYENFDIIYIDNDSSDGSVDFVRENFGEIGVVVNTKNIGYAAAYKKALRDVFGNNFDAAVLLNPDTVVDKNWLGELVKTAYRGEDIALVQSKIFLFDERKTSLLNTAGNSISYLGMGFCSDYKKKDIAIRDKEIVYASGAGMLVKKDPYFRIGELDDSFFSYVEDQDLAWRAHMMGYKVMLSAKSIMWHKYNFESTKRNNNKFYFLERNRLYFIVKNYSLKMIILLIPLFLTFDFLIILHSIINGYFFKKVKSYLSFVANVGGVLRKRRDIQMKRNIKDSCLLKLLSPDISFSEIDGFGLRVFNFFSRIYYDIVKIII